MNASRIRTTLLAAVAAVGFAATGSALHSGPSTAHATPSAIPTDGSIADAAERTVDSVVTISVTREGNADPMQQFFGQGVEGGGREEAKGSGVIVTANGRILTNAHVVNGFDNITVTLPDGTDVAAKVVGKDTKADLAVIQLKGTFPALKPITFGDSSVLRLGDIVLAVGDGLDIGKSVSMGIVSAKGRGGMGIEVYEDFIQTDAAINPGNSGGALVNLKGELVGINTAIASPSRGSSGIGFAIPSNMARPIMDMLVRDGRVTRGYLGVNPVTVDGEIAHKYKLGATSGVVLAHVEPDGPAGKAHLIEGDIVTAIDGAPMKSQQVLVNTIALSKPGSTITLDVVHKDGSKASVKAKLGTLPDEDQAAKQRHRGRNSQQMPFQGPNGQWQVPDGWQCQQTQNGIQCQSGGQP